MNRFMRYLSALMCLALITTGLPVFAENNGAEIVTVEETPAADNAEALAAVEASATTAAATATATATATAAPTPTPTPKPAVTINFATDSIELDVNKHRRVDAYSTLGLTVEGELKKTFVAWVTSDADIAAVSDKELHLFKTGTVTMTAMLATNTKIYDEIVINITESIEITGKNNGLSGTVVELGLQYLDGDTIHPEDAVWTTSNKDVARVVDGKVSCRDNGQATITATYKGITAEMVFTVGIVKDEPTPTPTAEPGATPAPGTSAEPTAAPGTSAEPTAAPSTTPAPQKSISFAKDSLNIDISALNGADAAKTLGLTLKDIAYADIVWTSSNKEVADINGASVISAKAGRTTLRAASKADPTIYAEIELNVTFDFNITGRTEGVVGIENNLICSYLNGTAIDSDDVKWSSSDATVAAVSNGEVTNLKPGTVTISVECNGVVKTITYKVLEPEVPFTATNVTMFSNGSGRIMLTALSGAEIDYSKVSYEFLDSEAEDYLKVNEEGYIVAIVDENGKMAADNEFTANVRVFYRGCTADAQVTVRQAKTSFFIVDGTEDGADAMELFESCSIEPEHRLSFEPYSTHDYPVSFVSTDENVFTSDVAAKTIKGVKKGTAELIVTMRSGSVFRVPVEVKIPISSITLEDPEKFFKVGDTFVINASYKPFDADHPIFWSSDNSSVAAVDHNGRVTCYGEGYAKIRAYSMLEGVSETIEIYVVKPVEKILFYKGIINNKTDFTIGVGKTFLPVIEVFPKDATLAGYSMVTSDPAVVQFNNAGKIVGMGVGKATVSFISLDGFVEREINITVVPKNRVVSSFKLSASKLSLGEGASKKITPKFNSSAYDKSVTWVSDGASVATVDANGVITAVAPGTCTIYAMASNGAYKSVKVTVKTQKPTKVKLNVTKGSIYPGEEYQFKATVYPTTIPREEMKVVKWKSSNTKVAIVNDEGHLFAIAPGKATITVTTVNGKKATCKVTVKKRPVSSVDIVNPYTEFIVGGSYDLDAKVSPENAYNTAVTWSSSNKKIATVNSSTGVVTCKKAGTVKITAKAKDGSGKKKVITIKVVNMPLKSMNVMIDEKEVVKQSTLTLPYGQTKTVKAVSDPVMYVSYKSSDERVATFKNGVITATGCGKATLTVTFGGQHARSFYVEVPYSPDAPRYRALVISQYATAGKSGFLPFSTNSSTGIVNALQLSDLEGSRYEVTYKKDLTSVAAVTSAIKTTFADAKEGDVSIVYLMTHATINSNGVFRFHLTRKNGSTIYMYPEELMNALKGVKGDVVLMVLSCKSGGDVENAENLTGMMRDIDKKAAAGNSYSVICASEGTMRASYANTDPSFSYDFFTYGLCQSLGWDMKKSKEAATSADANGDGVITLKEFAQATEVFTRDECASFIAKYGTSAYFGPPEQRQQVSYYISPNADNLTVFGK